MFIILLVVSAARVVPCGDPLRSSVHHSWTKVQFIFYVWSFESRGFIMRN